MTYLYIDTSISASIRAVKIVLQSCSLMKPRAFNAVYVPVADRCFRVHGWISVKDNAASSTSAKTHTQDEKSTASCNNVHVAKAAFIFSKAAF